jgi:bifunctional non-homologous end joining protein LigD
VVEISSLGSERGPAGHRPGALADVAIEAMVRREIAQAFRAKHPRRVTLALARADRRGRVFLDVYRHNPAQTAISPYSLRGRPGATAALPITWEILEGLDNPREFNLHTVPDLVDEHGDHWADFDKNRTHLHTQQPSSSSSLAEYDRKRSFDRTPEPAPRNGRTRGKGSRFVIHRHHATRLHYDLRLEERGVLKSWAVPKGLPPRPGINRLAVQTEDHPIEYLDFEGEIPKDEYGGGTMWVFDLGTYEHLKAPSERRLEFRLHGEGFHGEHRLFRKEGKDWLLQRIDEPAPDWLREPLEPMAPVLLEDVPADNELEYEVKWDGIRALFFIDEEQIRIVTRRGHDVTEQFPELLDPNAFRSQSAIIDVEIVVLDSRGHPNFEQILTRVQRRGRGGGRGRRRSGRGAPGREGGGGGAGGGG